jgi:glycine/D-amino acid oxidase-like deaminating enzyme
MKTKVAVLGTGIIGLLTAKRLQDLGYEPLVLSADVPLRTTSAAAGGVVLPFFPFAPGSAEFMRRMAWKRSSAKFYEEFAAGRYCSKVPHAEFCKDGLLEGSYPIDWLPGAELEDPEIVTLPEPFDGYQKFVRFSLFCVNTVGILQELLALALSRGAEYHAGRLTMAEISQLPVNVIFNCLGFGGAKIFADESVVPVFGQAIRFAPIAARFGVGIGDYFALATPHSFYIGSLFLKGQDGRDPRAELTRQLLHFANVTLRRLLPVIEYSADIWPLADDFQIVTGIRPYRMSGTRVELEHFGDKTIVHNYGHGAHGWTTGWGSVIEAVDLWQASAT